MMKPICNVVLVTKGSYGDVVPFLSIGKAMLERGHRVTLVSQCEYRDVARRLGLSFDSWDTPDQYRSFIRDGPLLDSPSGIAKFADRHIFPYVKSEYEGIRKYCGDPHTVLLVRHMGSMAAVFLSEQLRLPLVSVFTAAAQMTCVPILEQMYRQSLGARINDSRREFGLAGVTDWKKWVHLPSLHLACWPEWFARPISEWPSPVICLGFLQSDEVETGEVPPDVQHLLEDSNSPPILITGGTAVWLLAKRFYDVAAQACSLAHRPGILVCPHSELIPSPLPSGVISKSKLPFAEVVKRVGAIIHHGGTSVLVRALAGGVPQLMLPYGGDRPDTAMRVERMGVGKRSLPPQWVPATIAAELSRLIGSEPIKNACWQARDLLSQSDGLRNAYAAVESLAQGYSGHSRLA
jgi:rhamnosyltransferase subunit B